MIYFIFCTTGCNLHYCGNDPEEMCMPLKPQFTVAELQEFLEKDYKQTGEKPTLVLYGGEPLMNVKFVTELLEKIDAYFVLQTNGTMLNSLTKEQLDRFTAVLISIDGPKESVDVNRGKGTYDRCIAGCLAALKKTKIRNLVARGTAMEGNDIYESVKHLLFHPSVPFTHVYWQLNVGFDCPMRPTFEKWVDESYNPGITKLMDLWMKEMEENGRVLGIVPFLCLMDTMLEMDEKGMKDSSALGIIKPDNYGTDPNKTYPLGSIDEFNNEDEEEEEEKKKKEESASSSSSSSSETTSTPSPVYPIRPLRQIRCGIGQTAFSISTDGVISGCPCGVGEEWNTICKDFREVKDIKKELTEKIKFIKPCTECDIADVCGGRCVYSNATRWWGKQYERVVCNKTIRHLVTLVKKNMPRVKELIKEGRIEREPFKYPAEKYSLEVIP